MALYAFDGTGQKDDNPNLENTGDTNVARFASSKRTSSATTPSSTSSDSAGAPRWRSIS